MTEEVKKRLVKEAKTLERWRRMYLTQAMIVALLAGAFIVVVWTRVSFWEMRILLSLLAIAFFYEMQKSLQASLQARGEGMILALGEEVFGEVIFDVGRGICENALLAQDVCPPYQLRDCRNVMRGKGYWLEEDWFYSVISAKFLPINQTLFEGVVFAFADLDGEDGLKGEAFLKKGRVVLTGDLAAHLKRKKAEDTVGMFMRLFGIEKANLAIADKTLYLWMSTDRKLFYQFSLFRSNKLELFQKRIELLHKEAKKMLAVLNR